MRPTTVAFLLGAYALGFATPIAIVAMAVRGMRKPVPSEGYELAQRAEASVHGGRE